MKLIKTIKIIIDILIAWGKAIVGKYKDSTI